MDDRSNTVSSIAERLKSVYSTYRSLTSGMYRPADEHERFYTRAAKKCVETGVSPEVFISIAFKKLKPFPYPNQLQSDWLWESMRENLLAYEEEVRMRVHLQMKSIERIQKLGRSIRTFLLDINEGYDPLFIFVKATEQKFEDIASRFKESAFTKYLSCPTVYDAIYRNFIPRDFHDRARAKGG